MPKNYYDIKFRVINIIILSGVSVKKQIDCFENYCWKKRYLLWMDDMKFKKHIWKSV